MYINDHYKNKIMNYVNLNIIEFGNNSSNKN